MGDNSDRERIERLAGDRRVANADMVFAPDASDLMSFLALAAFIGAILMVCPS